MQHQLESAEEQLRYTKRNKNKNSKNKSKNKQIILTVMIINLFFFFFLFIDRVFEPDSDKFASLGEFQSCEVRLVEALRRVTQRKVRQTNNQDTSALFGSKILMRKENC